MTFNPHYWPGPWQLLPHIAFEQAEAAFEAVMAQARTAPAAETAAFDPACLPHRHPFSGSTGDQS